MINYVMFIYKYLSQDGNFENYFVKHSTCELSIKISFNKNCGQVWLSLVCDSIVRHSNLLSQNKNAQCDANSY